MRFLTFLILAPFLWANPSSAGDRPVLVELYTSQGCSSCPPADKLLHELVARDDVIALALHVDYWDYIGWKDVFGNAANTKRQRGYAKAGDRRMVYTPQMIIDGTDHVVGNRPKDVNALIRRHGAVPDSVAMKVIRKGNQVLIEARATKPIGTPLVVQIAKYTPQRTVAIERGENAGRTLSYANVVTELTELTRWNTSSPLALKTKVSPDQPVVVILQRPGYGAVEAVAQLQ
ncbi:DUF1223 domain-containing protein [Pseudohalocynthiibacter aestuariivivens]|nr:DUF1223 domain-containing protein [Pseudohalocynthiibacter aestuariivivens]QIE45340.1 DUF1223 domain-containing protein [Pseudohalocynthiibacter aestuariivivens]